MTDIPAPTLVCPFHETAQKRQRSRADVFVRKVLLVPDFPRRLTGRSVEGAFRRSMLISTIRCSLTYLVFPFILPALGLMSGVGVAVGAVIGLLAIACDVFTIRRFFAVDHKWRWHYAAAGSTVVCFLTLLLAQDLMSILS